MLDRRGFMSAFIAFAAGAGLATGVGVAALGSPFSLPRANDLDVDVTVVVRRLDDAIELYLAFPATGLTEFFSLSPARIEAGGLNYENLREGSWDLGDAVLEHASPRIGGGPAGFEAMSLMVHQTTLAPPLRDALDGLTAISVCAAPQPNRPPALSELRAYVGYIAYLEDTDASVRLALPGAARGEITVRIRDYAANGAVSERQLAVAPGADLVIPASVAPAAV